MKKYLLIAPLAFGLLFSCAKPSYQRCKDIYGTALQDSVTITHQVTVSVPKDSAVIVVDRQILLDSVPFHYYAESATGARATIRSLQNKQIELRADCPPKVVTRTITMKVPPTKNEFGVHPAWKDFAFTLLGLILFVAIVVFASLKLGKLIVAFK